MSSDVRDFRLGGGGGDDIVWIFLRNLPQELFYFQKHLFWLKIKSKYGFS